MVFWLHFLPIPFRKILSTRILFFSVSKEISLMDLKRLKCPEDIASLRPGPLSIFSIIFFMGVEFSI